MKYDKGLARSLYLDYLLNREKVSSKYKSITDFVELLNNIKVYQSVGVGGYYMFGTDKKNIIFDIFIGTTIPPDNQRKLYLYINKKFIDKNDIDVNLCNYLISKNLDIHSHVNKLRISKKIIYQLHNRNKLYELSIDIFKYFIS